MDDLLWPHNRPIAICVPTYPYYHTTNIHRGGSTTHYYLSYKFSCVGSSVKMVPETGVQPVRPYGHSVLSAACLAVPSPRHFLYIKSPCPKLFKHSLMIMFLEHSTTKIKLCGFFAPKSNRLYFDICYIYRCIIFLC